MDDKFMETIRSFSVQDMLDEQRPGTANGPSNRPPTASRGRNNNTTHARPPSSASRNDNEVTTLASYRPESAAFTFSFNRPRTGRMMDSSDRTSAMPRGRMPSATARNRMASARPGTSSVRRVDDTEYIPDLDDVRDDDMLMTVASAPAYELQKIASLKELDAELLQSKALSNVDGVNLQKLCRYLVPEKDLLEHDEVWTWDRLYTEIISTPDMSHLVRFHAKKESDTDYDSLTVK